MAELWVANVGRLPYAAGAELQDRVRAARQRDAIPDTLLLLEHDPVYTRGRRTERTDLPMGDDWYRAQGIEVADTSRGGRVTYHGPGQLVGYPIMRIGDVIEYVRTLERAGIAGLAGEGVGVAPGDRPAGRAAGGRGGRPRRGGARVSTRSRAHPGGARVLDMGEVRPYRERKPPWFKVRAPGGPRFLELKNMIEGEGLNTVCEEAACPNIGDCWDRGTATFMMLGDTCTRRCGFCNVKTGRPGPPDPLEPLRVAQSVKRMGLRHAVITSVDRDDLADLGSTAFVGVIRSIRRFAPRRQGAGLPPHFRRRENPPARAIPQ